jgi:O-succinylbenzoic acid--CoA ligase
MMFHNSFLLNGNSFDSVEELLKFSKKQVASIELFLSEWFNESEFIVVQTSGSTGKPKLIRLRKKYMINSAMATGDFFDCKENTTALLCMSTDYIAGKMMLVRSMTLGWKLDVVSPNSTPLSQLDAVYDFSAMVPIQLETSLDELHKVKKLIVGGGVISENLKKKILNIETEIFATYGMTETITHIAVKKLNNLPGTLSFYQTLPNVNICIDERNCLIINAPFVAEETIVTNDVVQLISENEFEWLGRFDNVINSGGVKLHPEIIENKLIDTIESRFFVIGEPDEKLGERLVLVIEDVSIDSNELLSRIRRVPNISKYEVPKEVYKTNQFIETETKKIQRFKTLSSIKK